ncbi:hypothetical protein BMS3Abin03_00827 [bacterium BMS3Abin03]|nr:hypothetical protein BMS3Abin03_00827 [bacterium BMS3Abin03]HDZ58493.1 hypothetical protein [Ignavibacteriales bacterium]
MKQAKISFKEDHIDFINKYSEFGFKDKSSLVRAAINEFKRKIERQKLAESAKLYAELYEVDDELKELTNSAISGWPE